MNDPEISSLLLGKAHRLKPTLARYCANYFSGVILWQEVAVRNTEIHVLPIPEEFRKGQRRTPRVSNHSSQNPCWASIWLRMHALSGRTEPLNDLAKDNSGNPTSFHKPKTTASARSSSPGFLTFGSTWACFQQKPLALVSMCSLTINIFISINSAFLTKVPCKIVSL